MISSLGDDYFSSGPVTNIPPPPVTRTVCPPPSLAIQFQTVAITHAVVQITGSQFGRSGIGAPAFPYYTDTQNPWPITVGIEVFCEVEDPSGIPVIQAFQEFTVGPPTGSTLYPKQSVCVCKELDETLKAGCGQPAFVAVYIKTGRALGNTAGSLNGGIFTPFNVAVTLHYKTQGKFGQ